MSVLEKETEPNPYYSCSDEQYIAEEAAQMAGDILYGRIEKKGHWQDKLKTRVMKLLWQAHLNSVVPPYDLVILIGLLFGDRHDLPASKYIVIEELASRYNPPKKGGRLPRGARQFAAITLAEHGGVLSEPRSRKDGKEVEVEKRCLSTVDGWFKEPLFLGLWANKRRIFLNRSGDFSYILDKELRDIIENHLLIKE